MAQDLADHLAALPVLRVYDQGAVRAFVEATHEEIWRLSDQLDAAEARWAAAHEELERRQRARTSTVDATLVEAEAGVVLVMRQLETEIEAVRRSAETEVEHILATAEADAAAIRTALAARAATAE